MGLDDRDWYRDVQRERQGLKPKWQLWKSGSNRIQTDPHNPYSLRNLRASPKRNPKPRPFFVAIFLLVLMYLVYRFFLIDLFFLSF